jgi:peptidoglycan/LPS O-acetylase OafA/YrhL
VLKFLGDFLVIVSVVLLAFPAWYANRYGHRLARIDLDGLQLGAPEFQTNYTKLVEGLKEERDGWKAWKGWCFWVGTLAGVVAAVILLGTDLTEHTTPSPPPGAQQ